MRTLTVPAETEQLDAVTAFTEAYLETLGCPVKTRMQIALSVEEIFVNVANYAYGAGGGEAELRLSYEEGVLTVSLLDSGAPYDPLAKPDPDVTLPADERPIGGLGIFLVKKNMDGVRYRYENGRNVLTMTKKLQ